MVNVSVRVGAKADSMGRGGPFPAPRRDSSQCDSSRVSPSERVPGANTDSSEKSLIDVERILTAYGQSIYTTSEILRAREGLLTCVSAGPGADGRIAASYSLFLEPGPLMILFLSHLTLRVLLKLQMIPSDPWSSA